MKIHQLRNATLVIETENIVLLVDPMLGKKATLPPFTFFRFKPKRNPLVDLPQNSEAILDKVTHCIITHKHPDHIDKDGETFLIKKNIPVYCNTLDKKHFAKKGLNIVDTFNYWQKKDFLGGKITGIPAVHGYGFIAKPMGDVMGFFIELPNQPTLYVSADTVYTADVDKVLKELKPDVSILASGSAQFDIGKPLLMNMEDITRFIKTSSGKVICNHMEAVNHCPTTREQMRTNFKNELNTKVLIPEDGEVISL